MDFDYILENWGNPPADSSQAYIADLLLSNLAKARDWRNEKRQRALFLLWRNRAEIEATAADNFVERVRAVDKTLNKFQYCAESLVLSNDADEWEFEVQDEAGNFLVAYESLCLVRKGLAQNGLKAPVFFEEFRQLEGKFRDWFGYFHSELPAIEYIRESEPALKGCWWLTETPDPAAITNRKYTADDYDRLMRAISGEGFRVDCPGTELVIGFALKERSDSEIKRHLEKCPACRCLADCIEAAEKEAAAMGAVPEIPRKLRDALKL